MNYYSDWIQPDDELVTVTTFGATDYQSYNQRQIDYTSGWPPAEVDPNVTLTTADSDAPWGATASPAFAPPLVDYRYEADAYTDASTGWSEQGFRYDYSVSLRPPQSALNPQIPATWPAGAIDYQTESSLGMPIAATCSLVIAETCIITLDQTAGSSPLDPGQAPIVTKLGTVAFTGSETVTDGNATNVATLDSGNGSGGDGVQWNINFDVPTLGQYGFHVVPRTRRPPSPPWAKQYPTVNGQVHIIRDFVLQSTSTNFTIRPPRYRWVYASSSQRVTHLRRRHPAEWTRRWPPKQAQPLSTRRAGGHW